MTNFFSKFCIGLILSAQIFTLKTEHVFAETNSPLSIYLFYGEGCPHCAKERDFLSRYAEENPGTISLHEYEVYYNQHNQDLFTQVLTLYNSKIYGVPFLVIGDHAIAGYNSDETTGEEISSALASCTSDSCEDLVATLLNNEDESSSDIAISYTNNESTDDESEVALPFFGKVNLKDFSLPIATIVIALVDGFNPCAMWILIFLITLLINLKDRKKLLLLGTTFILTSGIVYFIFLAAWLNFFHFIGYVYWIKIIVGLVAIASGVLHMRSALQSKGECHATNEKQRSTIMERTKKAIAQKSFLLALVGIVILALSVNLVEVVCSAGLPAIYTNLLASVNLSGAEYYLYLLLYVAVFMLDDLLIFLLALKTFEVFGITKKYTKWSNLIGGIIIFIIGIILIVKPELLMFG